jgi:ABC-type sulfate transport system substrate-binding protein
MAYSFHNKRSGLEVGDALDDKFQDFVKVIEKGVPKFGDSTGTFMTDMVLYGPSKYDLVIVYENLAIQSIPNAQGRWGNLRVYYPEQTMWSSHPAVVMQGEWVTAEQRDAARKLIKFLRAPDQQKLALQYGFRPGDPTVPLKGADNPFEKATAFGVKLDIPSVVEPPPAPVIHNLMEMWGRLIGR